MTSLKQALVPDIGDFHDLPVVELLVAVGDRVDKDQGLMALESDKATMEVPSAFAGIVRELKVALGDTVSEGSVVALIETAADATHASDTPPAAVAEADAAIETTTTTAAAPTPPATPPVADVAPRNEAAPPRRLVHASPAVRALARRHGIDLDGVAGSGKGGRIRREDLQRAIDAAAGTAAVVAVTPDRSAAARPPIDFARIGDVEVQPLSRLRRLSGANLARNWALIPHVTQHDTADITELEALRIALNEERGGRGIKLTLLAFLLKASAAALRRYPEFCASLDAAGEHLTLKRYVHVGFAADTPNGLLVPVIRDVDRKGVDQIAEEAAELAAKARAGTLSPAEMSGGCFSISSLGGIGGTAFTPIINAPEVAILGVSRASMQPLWDGTQFRPRRRLPLSLSYDHRVIDGAAAARFIGYLGVLLADLRRALL